MRTFVALKMSIQVEYPLTEMPGTRSISDLGVCLDFGIPAYTLLADYPRLKLQNVPKSKLFQIRDAQPMLEKKSQTMNLSFQTLRN